MPRSWKDGVMQNSGWGFWHRHAMPICGLAEFGHAVLALSYSARARLPARANV